MTEIQQNQITTNNWNVSYLHVKHKVPESGPKITLKIYDIYLKVNANNRAICLTAKKKKKQLIIYNFPAFDQDKKYLLLHIEDAQRRIITC